MLTVRDGNKQDWGAMSLIEIAEGNAMDAFCTLEIFYLLEAQLKENPTLYDVYVNMISPMNAEFAFMEFDGFDISLDHLEEVRGNLIKSVDVTKADLYDSPYVNDGIVPSKIADLISVLYEDEDGMTLYPPAFTKGEKPSTAKETLEKLESLIEAELTKRAKKK